MTYTVLYRDTGSVIGHHADRESAVRDAVSIALDRPDLTFLVGVVEIGEDGMPLAPFASASDLLATNDPDAIAVADRHDQNDAEVAGTAAEAGVLFEREHDPGVDVLIESRGPNPRPSGQPSAMTKSELVAKVAAESGMSTEDADTAVDAVISSMEAVLRSGEEINFTGFGKFHVGEPGASEGRNPRTGETMTIAASKVPRWRETLRLEISGRPAPPDDEPES
jgi:DNA-binding protein HU-beta